MPGEMTKEQILKAQKDGQIVKYVRLADQFVFGYMDSWAHADLADGRRALSAGFVGFKVDGTAIIQEDGSISLKRYPHRTDKAEMEKFLTALKA